MVGLARHGESEANLAGIWHGITDGPLSSRGLAQGAELSARYDAVDHIYSSHLQRARLTAAAFGAGRGLEPAVRPDLHEMAYGRWEGLTSEEIQELFPDDWAANYVRRGGPAPGPHRGDGRRGGGPDAAGGGGDRRRPPRGPGAGVQPRRGHPRLRRGDPGPGGGGPRPAGEPGQHLGHPPAGGAGGDRRSPTTTPA